MSILIEAQNANATSRLTSTSHCQTRVRSFRRSSLCSDMRPCGAAFDTVNTSRTRGRRRLQRRQRRPLRLLQTRRLRPLMRCRLHFDASPLHSSLRRCRRRRRLLSLTAVAQSSPRPDTSAASFALRSCRLQCHRLSRCLLPETSTAQALFAAAFRVFDVWRV